MIGSPGTGWAPVNVDNGEGAIDRTLDVDVGSDVEATPAREDVFGLQVIAAGVHRGRSLRHLDLHHDGITDLADPGEVAGDLLVGRSREKAAVGEGIALAELLLQPWRSVHVNPSVNLSRCLTTVGNRSIKRRNKIMRPFQVRVRVRIHKPGLGGQIGTTAQE